MSEPVLAHSATKLAGTAGRVVVCGSHGGRYAGLLAVAAGVRAILLNDAGVGLDNAGIAGLATCEDNAVPAATLSHTSCRIGHAGSAHQEGIVSHANRLAAALGVEVGQSADTAARCLAAAPQTEARPMAEDEHRSEDRSGQTRVIVMDSNGLVRPRDDDGAIIITASHGGLVGDDPASAGRAQAALFAFNDAGVGKDGAGLTRLPVLDARGIPAVTVGHNTARIGDGASTLETGVITHTNAAANAAGARAGMPLAVLVALIGEAA